MSRTRSSRRRRAEPRLQLTRPSQPPYVGAGPHGPQETKDDREDSLACSSARGAGTRRMDGSRFAGPGPGRNIRGHRFSKGTVGNQNSAGDHRPHPVHDGSGADLPAICSIESPRMRDASALLNKMLVSGACTTRPNFICCSSRRYCSSPLPTDSDRAVPASRGSCCMAGSSKG